MEQVLRNEANSGGQSDGERRGKAGKSLPWEFVCETKPIPAARMNLATTDWLRLYKLRLRTIPTTRRTRLAIC
jgi:hypothetical protein